MYKKLLRNNYHIINNCCSLAICFTNIVICTQPCPDVLVPFAIQLIGQLNETFVMKLIVYA